jgi:hypothetical protein
MCFDLNDLDVKDLYLVNIPTLLKLSKTTPLLMGRCELSQLYIGSVWFQLNLYLFRHHTCKNATGVAEYA